MDKGNPGDNSRFCDHCEKRIPDDEPVNRVFGWDDGICADCLDRFNSESMEASGPTLKDRFAQIIIEDLKDRGLTEQAERLIEQIVKKNEQSKSAR